MGRAMGLRWVYSTCPRVAYESAMRSRWVPHGPVTAGGTMERPMGLPWSFFKILPGTVNRYPWQNWTVMVSMWQPTAL